MHPGAGDALRGGPWSDFLLWLGRRDVFIGLVVANVLVTCIVLWASRGTILSDTWTYLALAEGILHGRYSMWWPMEEFYPDTFRAPGYPMFVAIVIKLLGTWKTVLAVQFVMYWAAIHFVLRTIRELDPSRAVRSLFLVLLLPMVNIPFYIGQLYTEIPVLLVMSVVGYLAVRPKPWSVGVAMLTGFLLGFAFQCKPAFLLLPPLLLVVGWWCHRKEGWAWLKGYTVMVTVFGVTLLPFGLWNLRHHGVFKVTPLDGGGGYMHFSYWCGKFPGYRDTFSLGNFAGDEIIRFTPQDSIPANIERYSREWAMINARTVFLLTAKDSLMLASRGKMPYPVEPTYNSKFVLTRERLLTERGLKLMWEDPWYTLAYKSYSAVRLWVIGLQPSDFHEASFGGRVQMIHATVSTGLSFLMFLALVPLAYRRRAIDLRRTWPLLVMLFYVTLVHIPFTIQSRYTVCVRLVMLTLLTFGVMGLVGRRALGK